MDPEETNDISTSDSTAQLAPSEAPIEELNEGAQASEVITDALSMAPANDTAIEPAAEAIGNTGLLGDVWGSALNLLELGGPVVTILIIMSVFGFAIALFKFFQFSSLSVGRFKQMHAAIDAWQIGDSNNAKEQLEKVKWPLADTVQFGLDNQHTENEEQLREELSRQANNFLNPYAKYLRPLELIYYLAPVLGLLGTVLGMIEAFKGLEASTGLDKDSTALAGGIWEALLTTAVGLSIAIPFTLIHAWLETRLDNITQLTSDLLTRVVTLNVSRSKNST
jgi:biopolymer transport protein ExbB